MFKKRIVKKDNTRSVEKRKFEDDADDVVDVVDGSKDVPSAGGKDKTTHKPEDRLKRSKIEPSAAISTSLEKESKPREVTGPLKDIPQNIKTTTIVDFQPDVCKDFLQTGYCGYGDTCKFLHVRDELKQKKPVEKEWEKTETPKSEAKPLPFKCVICKKDYKSPVQTNCGHLFCQKCFLERSKKKPNCIICGKDTSGVCKPILASELEKLIN